MLKRAYMCHNDIFLVCVRNVNKNENVMFMTCAADDAYAFGVVFLLLSLLILRFLPTFLFSKRVPFVTRAMMWNCYHFIFINWENIYMTIRMCVCVWCTVHDIKWMFFVKKKEGRKLGKLQSGFAGMFHISSHFQQFFV